METLFGSAERLRVLERLLARPGERVSVRNVARETQTSPWHASKVLKRLERAGLARKGIVDGDSARTRALKIFLNAERLFPLHGLLQRVPTARGAGVYGSWANGTNSAESDCDVWVKAGTAIRPVEEARLKRRVEEQLGVSADVLVLTPERVRELRETNAVFYYALYHSFRLWGENID